VTEEIQQVQTAVAGQARVPPYYVEMDTNSGQAGKKQHMRTPYYAAKATLPLVDVTLRTQKTEETQVHIAEVGIEARQLGRDSGTQSVHVELREEAG
jgi:hypothetical protein